MSDLGFRLPEAGHAVGSQHLATGATSGVPVVIAAASGRGTTAITEPAAGPAESRQNGGGAKIHRRSRPPCAGDDVGRAGLATCPPDRMNSSGGPLIYRWRGREYIGARAVAAAAGVHIRTVQWHLARHGSLRFLGVGPGTGPNNCRVGGRRLPISLFGREWPSRAALALDMGISLRSLHRQLAEGRVDLILAHLMRADAERMAAAAKERA